MKVAISNVHIIDFRNDIDRIERFKEYTFDLKEFYISEDVTFSMYFDMWEIGKKLIESKGNPNNWKTCEIRKIKDGSLLVKLKSYGLRDANGFMMYSMNKTQNLTFHDCYSHLRLKDYFSISANSLSGKIISKVNPLEDISVISVYKSINKKKKKNIFSHVGAFTFYSDHSFLYENHGPGMEISMTSEYVLGIGFWEIVGDELILITPFNWLSSFDVEKFYTKAEIYSFHEEVYIIKGRKLFQQEKYHSDHFFKWVKTKGQQRLKRQ